MSKSDDMAFTQFMVDQVPVFDSLILEDIRPNDGWLLNISEVPRHPKWWLRREEVRKISEGDHYQETKSSKVRGVPVEITQDRFKSVWPQSNL